MRINDRIKHARAAARYLWCALRIPGADMLVGEAWSIVAVHSFAAGRSAAIEFLARIDAEHLRIPTANVDFDDEVTEIRCVILPGIGRERRPWSRR